MHSSHIDALQSKHAGLETQLKAEMNRPAPDGVKIKAIKQQKLRIKEEIAHI